MVKLTDEEKRKYYIAREKEAVALAWDDLSWLLPQRDPDSNKGSFGKTLVFAGCETIGGAAYLASYAALLMGCGMVRILTHEAQRTALTVLLPEALISTYERAEDVIEAVRWADVIVAGCGIGQSERAAKLLTLIVENAKERPLVLDADALNLIAAGRVSLPDDGTETVITPHLMEMSRLTGIDVAGIKENKAGIAEEYAKEHNVTVVLKDAVTVTALCADTAAARTDNENTKDSCSPGKEAKCFINLSGNDGMATAGSGDVLAGMTGGLIASAIHTDTDRRMLVPAAVYIHGLCGDAAAERRGRRSLTARDLLAAIPEVMMRI